jgi:hypothetical protein
MIGRATSVPALALSFFVPRTPNRSINRETTRAASRKPCWRRASSLATRSRCSTFPAAHGNASVVEESPPKVLASGAASVGINATIVEDVTRAEDFVHRRCGTVFVRPDDPFILEEMGATEPPEEHEYLVCPVLPEIVKSIYKIDVLVLDGKVQRHEFAGVDTCSSSNLIDAAAVPAEVDLHPCSQRGLTDASRNMIFVESLAMIPLRIGNLQTVLPM